MLLQTISQSGNSGIPTVLNFTSKIVTGVDVTPNSLLWFRPYKSSDHPNIECDKTYFFLYSTNHDAGDGGIWWGKGNHLSLEDFEEISSAPIVTGYQAETPFLVTRAGETRPVFLYYHTANGEPGNESIQRTRLLTTTGGLLHSATWTDEGRPLLKEGDDDHLGYLKVYKLGTDNYIGSHYTRGSTPSPVFIGEWNISTATDDLTSWTRGDEIDCTSFMPPGRRIIPSYGSYFQAYGRWWWIGFSEAMTGFAIGENTKGIAICKALPTLQIQEFCTELNNGIYNRFDPEIYVEGDTIHFYCNDPSSGTLQYASTPIEILLNYL